MILTPSEYSQQFKLNGKRVSYKTVIRRCEKGLLPFGHKAIQKGCHWLIEVVQKQTAIN